MTRNNKPVNQYDLLMTYLNENDKQSNEDILTSTDGCQQLDNLKNNMNSIEEILNNYEPDESYGEQLWNRISDKLEPVKQPSWLDKIQSYLTVPQYSMASIFAVLMMVGGVYLVGSRHFAQVDNLMSNQLLAQNIQLHLTQTSILLTQINNMDNADYSVKSQNAASYLLANNRLFSMAYQGKDQQAIKQLLNNIEMILLQLSNGDRNYNPITNDSNSQSLLFRVNSMNSKLNQQGTSI